MGGAAHHVSTSREHIPPHGICHHVSTSHPRHPFLQVVEQERRTAVGREAEVKKLSEGREQLKAQMEGYCQCMEEQKKTLALANENITLYDNKDIGSEGRM